MQIIDTDKDPYGRRYYARKKRVDFEKLKRTAGFKAWKGHQLKIQDGRCAYCKIRLDSHNIVTHIDHVQPLYYDGKNEYSNLVLACRRCNVKKWISDRRVVPEWIKQNEVKVKTEQRLKAFRWRQRKQMEDLITQELDEQISRNMKAWL